MLNRTSCMIAVATLTILNIHQPAYSCEQVGKMRESRSVSGQTGVGDSKLGVTSLGGPSVDPDSPVVDTLVIPAISGAAPPCCAMKVGAKRQGLSLKAAKLVLALPGTGFIDVREPQEFATSHPAGALNLPLSKIDQWGPTLDKEAVYVVTCRSGRRSKTAAERLVSMGIAKAHTLEGGLEAWGQAGLPLEKVLH